MNVVHLPAAEFLAKAQTGEVTIDSHRQRLYLAYICLNDAKDYEVFEAVDVFRENGWTFGSGDLKFNRSLDTLYFAIMDDIVCNRAPDTDGIPPESDYNLVVDHYYDEMAEDAWKEYYSPAFLQLPTTAQFYRLPNLKDVPNSDGPVGDPRNKGKGNFTALPRWADHVYRTIKRQPALATDTIVELAMTTLKQTIHDQQNSDAKVSPYSETQTRFWLDRKISELSEFHWAPSDHEMWWMPNMFGYSIAQGGFDVWAWEAHYTPERWMTTSASRLEPDLDGTRPSEIEHTGWPDGGAGLYGCIRGWEPEVGSEEEVAFSAAVAVKETELADLDALDYTIRSHILLAILRAVFLKDKKTKDEYLKEVKLRMVEAGRVGEDRVDEWVQQSLMLIEPYAAEEKDWPEGQDRLDLLHRVLVNNGQLFARWGWVVGNRMPAKAAVFDLGRPRKK